MPTETILILDDDEMVRRLMVRVLGRLGYTLLQAGSGPEALAVLAAQAGPVHLLLVDLRLRVTSGQQAAKEIRARYPGIRTLYTSGGSDPGDGSFLQKPFTPDALAEKVRAVLDSPIEPA